MTNLLSAWTFWFHQHDTKDWSRESYKKIHKICSAEELWGVYKLLNNSHLSNGIFFLMKNDIFPDWKSPENINGGFWSFKIELNPKKNNSVMDILKMWIAYLVADKLIEETQSDISIHGISLSPKNNHFVLKIWIQNKNTVKPNTSFCKKLPFVDSCKFTPFSNK